MPGGAEDLSVATPRAEAAAPEASRVSSLALGMAGSLILEVAADVRSRTARGRQICDLTIGDFDSRQFPIPPVLRDGIIAALGAGETNYPVGPGMPALREAIRRFSRERLGIGYPLESVLVTSGARPVLYSAYRTLVDPGDRVVFPVPSWQNSYYCQLVGATEVPVSCGVATDFLPSRETLEPSLRGARLLVLNSPVNPTGTMFRADALAAICDLVLQENARRRGRERPLYLLYDQVYWMLTFGAIPHVTPVALRPAMAEYTISLDAISKSFAATGLRVGWALGPPDVVRYMGDLVVHMGAWAPRPEQVATAVLLGSSEAIAEYHRTMNRGLKERLGVLHAGVLAMRAAGLPVDATAPAGAIYLSARFALAGYRTASGRRLVTNQDIRRYLLDEADFAAVPFQAFGVPEDTGWFRLSVGAVSVGDIEAALPKVRAALERVIAPE
jgi:aspartate aminotransferase